MARHSMMTVRSVRYVLAKYPFPWLEGSRWILGRAPDADEFQSISD